MEPTDPGVGDHTLVAHPILVNRPAICTPKGVALCRLSKAMLPLLERARPARC